LASALALAILLTVLGGCGVARYGDDASDTTVAGGASTTAVDLTTTAAPPTTVALDPSATTLPRQATEDITDASDTALSIDSTSPYCLIVREWAEIDPTLAEAYDPEDPAMLEAAYRAIADEKRRLTEVPPPEIAAELVLVSQYWEQVIEIFTRAGWDYGRLFRRPDAETTAAVQGDRPTQNAITRISEHDARVCGLG
jgi:hypothetical protein